MNQSAFYLGVPGAGKSFAVKELIAFLMLHPDYADDDILICDPEGEFGALVKTLGREKATVAHLVAGGKDRLNAMYMVEGYGAVSYTHLDVYKRQAGKEVAECPITG